MEMDQVLKHYAIDYEKCEIIEFGNGLINHTWKVNLYPASFNLLVQRINNTVFKDPIAIAENIRMIADYLEKKNPHYLLIAPLKTKEGKEYFHSPESGYIRVFQFLEKAISVNVVNDPVEAYEAALQFGVFTKLLAGFNVRKLNITIPDFHNLTLRYNQFTKALTEGNRERILETETLITYLQSQFSIVENYENLKSSGACPQRVMHHDTKISNVLFNDQKKGLCVIDLDTLMPGYFFSDLGDMMRTYLSPASEEEGDFNKIIIRDNVFEAILKGYLFSMDSELTEMEKQHLVYPGKFMIYMQALRFLTDYLQNDIYYRPLYTNHNLVRAGNQMRLLQEYIKKEQQLERIARDVLIKDKARG